MTAEVRLEPVNDADLQFLATLVADPAVRRFTRVPDPPPADFPAAWLAVYREGRVTGTREGFVVLEHDVPVGVAVAANIDRPAETIELGYVIAEAARGRGLATHALLLLTAWAFDTFPSIERIELRISVDNPGSQKVAKNAGYTLEGVLRNAYLKPGFREDTQVWSLLPSEWRAT